MTFFKYVNVFGKPEGQNDVCISYALARKGRKDFNVFSSVCIRVIRVQNLFPLISYFSLRARTVFLCFFFHRFLACNAAYEAGDE